ncbi:glycosyltransferase family A protein [Candidatus Mycoplasma pogonae]
MQKPVLMTVLVPVYNKVTFLPKFFQSLLKQVDKNVNIIFLDDASTDASLKMLQDFEAKFASKFRGVKIIQLNQNGGLANARNVLINAVETAYFYFADPDDWFYKKTFVEFNRALRKKPGVEVVLARNNFGINNFRIINVTYNSLGFRWQQLTTKKQASELYIENGIATIWNKAINTAWFKSLGLKFIKGSNYEDIYVGLALFLKMHKTYFIDKATYFYNWNAQGLSAVHDHKKVEDFFINLHKLYDFATQENLLHKFRESTNLEKHYLKLIFISCFSDITYRKTRKNLEQYAQAHQIIAELNQKYDLETRMKKKYLTPLAWMFQPAFKNYQKFMKNFN